MDFHELQNAVPLAFGQIIVKFRVLGAFGNASEQRPDVPGVHDETGYFYFRQLGFRRLARWFHWRWVEVKNTPLYDDLIGVV
jgi:hypothetical protein